MLLRRAQMPSLQELAAFEAAGRHGSFTRAAEELSLTQSAVSKQIRELESTLGATLFERVKGRVVLTKAGNAFLASARKILADYASSAHSIMASAGSERTLKIGVLPTFATRWLIPRLPGYFARHPMVTFQLVTESQPFDLAERSADIAIHFGLPNWAHAEMTHLWDEDVIAVAHASYIVEHDLREPADLMRAALLQQATRPNLWRDWFAAAGAEHPSPQRGPLFDQFSMVAAAAAAGIGVGLVPSFLVERELAEGALTALEMVAPLRGNGSYFAVTPIGGQRDPDVASFIDWLAAESRSSARADQPDPENNPPEAPGEDLSG
ncbi:MAG: LysR family transcriptional regulator [Methylobacterium sp.]|nr:LysR family transcriptional regulator [Methylobacterium sp.]